MLLVFPRETNHSPQRLNALGRNGCIYLASDRIGSLVAKLFLRQTVEFAPC
jgi:hypothetical protein